MRFIGGIGLEIRIHQIGYNLPTAGPAILHSAFCVLHLKGVPFRGCCRSVTEGAFKCKTQNKPFRPQGAQSLL